jgi:6-pyruvoyltetrahydropterin/6-carboxytetrahydropterin synthase
LSENHPCTGVHSHRWTAEVVVLMPRLVPTDGACELAALEPLRRHVRRELDSRHLNDVLLGAPTPARLAWHLAVWCRENLAGGTAALASVLISSDTGSRVRYTPPRATPPRPVDAAAITRAGRGN